MVWIYLDLDPSRWFPKIIRLRGVGVIRKPGGKFGGGHEWLLGAGSNWLRKKGYKKRSSKTEESLLAKDLSGDIL